MMTNSDFIQALRDMADFFGARPDLEPPSRLEIDAPRLVGKYYSRVQGLPVDTVEGQLAFARAVGGKVTKEVDSTFFRLTADRGTFTLQTAGYREQICRWVQVGTRSEPAHVIPAVPERAVPAQRVPVYEWECPSLLASAEAAKPEPEGRA